MQIDETTQVVLTGDDWENSQWAFQAEAFKNIILLAY